MTTDTTIPLVIRPASKSDIAIISTMAHAIWPEAYGSILSEAQLKYMLNLFYDHSALEKQFDDQHKFFIALLAAETVGFASYSHDNQVGVFKVHKLYVHPMLQRKGIGKDLLDRIRAEVIAAGGTALRLNVNRKNAACDFYKKYGFRIVGEEDVAIGEGYFMNDYVMELPLS